MLPSEPGLYVPVIGARLGFDEVICTQVAWHGDRLDGALLTENRRGTESGAFSRGCAPAIRRARRRLWEHRLTEHLERCDEACW